MGTGHSMTDAVGEEAREGYSLAESDFRLKG
jgi:hypothetical protein